MVGHRVWHQIASADGNEVARAWFVGSNPTLDESSPIEAIRDGDFQSVIDAAQEFIEEKGNE